VSEPTDIKPDDGVSGRGSRSKTRQIVLLAVLLALIALVLFASWYYLTHRRLPIPRIGIDAAEIVAPPEFQFAIAGPRGPDALTRPIGVAVLGDSVYITDTDARAVRVYSLNGEYRFSFSAIGDGEYESLGNPHHISAGPDGNIYVSDRRHRSIFVFSADGTFIRRIAPTGTDEQLWSPLGTTFDAQGNIWATDVGIAENHRVIAFDPQGVEIQRFGSTVMVEQMMESPGRLFFPNHIAISDDGRVFVSDSNNRRVQVFDKEGEFDYIIATAGIPRGLAIDEQDRLYVVDALAHAIDVYDLDGNKITSFGGRGIGPGQFSFANAIDLDAAGRIYVTDRENHQVQVWEWPQQAIVLPVPPGFRVETLAWLLPLLLLPLLPFLLRRRKFVVTEDFVDALIEAGRVDLLRRRFRMFLTPEQIHPAFAGRLIEGDDLGKLIRKSAFSDSDARVLVAKHGLGYEDAALLVLAKRAKRLCTQDARLASQARRLGIEVFDVKGYVERFGKTVRR